MSVLLLMYTFTGGLLIDVPTDVGQLDETIRNLFYHVPMWFAMMFLLLLSMIYSILYLRTFNPRHDTMARELVNTGLLCGMAGIFTGMVWASATWGAPWTNDPKLNGAAAGVLVYAGYVFLRKSIDDTDKQARLASVYNIFVYPVFIALILILPKLSSFSIHPGSGDTVGFNQYDLNNNMRLVFYPAIVGWILLFLWITQIRVRLTTLKNNKDEEVDISKHTVLHQ